MSGIYLNDWKNGGLTQMLGDFDLREDSHEVDQAEILLASYSYANYEGEAFVLFRKDDKLFEVNGAHCSCYELEGQWRPEETAKEALLHRMEKGSLGGDSYCDNVFADELRAVLEKIQ